MEPGIGGGKELDCHLNTSSNLVDAPHRLDSLLLAAQLRLPQELGPRRRLHLAVDQVQQAGQEQHQHRHGDAERPGPGENVYEALIR